MKVYFAVVIVALTSCLAIAKLEDGECEGTPYYIYRIKTLNLCIISVCEIFNEVLPAS